MRYRRWCLAACLLATAAWAQAPPPAPVVPPQVQEQAEQPSLFTRFLRFLFHIFGGDQPQVRSPFSDDCLDPACRQFPRHPEPQPPLR